MIAYWIRLGLWTRRSSPCYHKAPSRLREGYPVVSGGRRGASVRRMTSIRLTILALAILAASAVAGIAAYAAGVVDPGFTYGFSHDDAGSRR